MKINASFVFARETKNTYRYEELGPNLTPAANSQIGVIYIKKWAVEGKPPNYIKVSVEAK